MEDNTAHNTGFQLNLCVSYGARSDLVQGCRQVASKVAAGELAAHDITEHTLRANLTTAQLPEPDIVIRTSGEQRLSNFLLYEAAYSELFFLDKYWPELTKEDLSAVFDQFDARKRRFGR